MDNFSRYCKVFTSPGGFTVLVAKSASDSEYLTFDIAQQSDLFFHVADTPGAHTVLVRSDGSVEVPKIDLEFAARQAALYSKQKNASRVPVHYCEIRHVHRSPGPYTGTVLVSKVKKIVVRM
ncbi:MAG: NFACT RNA binding domain-containing protein [Candidatus Wallbacteria bacterium]|nr:NFACT RNA binding domain-containing protein [Candidatus Wallbacteria bacterium]